jgi:ribosomal protein S27E
MTVAMDEKPTWLRLSCPRCGAHAVVGADQARVALCPVCTDGGLELVGEEAEPPRAALPPDGVKGEPAQVAAGRFSRAPSRSQRA